VAGVGISAQWTIIVLGRFKAMLSGTKIKQLVSVAVIPGNYSSMMPKVRIEEAQVIVG
jgi:hypothetical protein